MGGCLGGIKNNWWLHLSHLKPLYFLFFTMCSDLYFFNRTVFVISIHISILGRAIILTKMDQYIIFCNEAPAQLNT